ncbi:hypothetical protein, unlikely [Trypanosoma congolense IL3000]|uniref:Uncharacterized protein n=1 Tax=Trypanosoma congolense (strain IL3000) TaxID=1068625 RepID=F9W8J9_TRYCI|nr:hypothetical protein, unlikely [Trypanosoma congolense IL3000]
MKPAPQGECNKEKHTPLRMCGVAYCLKYSLSDGIPQQMFVVPQLSPSIFTLFDKGNIISKKSAYFRRFLEKSDSLSSPCSSLIMLLPSPQNFSSSTERLSSDKFPLRELACMVEYSLLNSVHHFDIDKQEGNIQWGEKCTSMRERVVY